MKCFYKILLTGIDSKEVIPLDVYRIRPDKAILT